MGLSYSQPSSAPRDEKKFSEKETRRVVQPAQLGAVRHGQQLAQRAHSVLEVAGEGADLGVRGLHLRRGGHPLAQRHAPPPLRVGDAAALQLDGGEARGVSRVRQHHPLRERVREEARRQDDRVLGVRCGRLDRRDAAAARLEGVRLFTAVGVKRRCSHPSSLRVSRASAVPSSILRRFSYGQVAGGLLEGSWRVGGGPIPRQGLLEDDVEHGRHHELHVVRVGGARRVRVDLALLRPVVEREEARLEIDGGVVLINN